MTESADYAKPPTSLTLSKLVEANAKSLNAIKKVASQLVTTWGISMLTFMMFPSKTLQYYSHLLHLKAWGRGQCLAPPPFSSCRCQRPAAAAWWGTAPGDPARPAVTAHWCCKWPACLQASTGKANIGTNQSEQKNHLPTANLLTSFHQIRLLTVV